MEAVVTLLIILLLVAATNWGVDSRPGFDSNRADLERPTRWWPGTPRR